MTVRLRRFTDPIAFGEAVVPHLLTREAENSLPLGLIATLSIGGSVYSGDIYLAALESGGQTFGVAMMTPPYGPLISRMTDPIALDVLIDDLLPRRDEVRTVFGPAESSRVFAERWAAVTGQSTIRASAQRIFQLKTVFPPEVIAGKMREAGEPDQALLAELLHAFYLESIGREAPHLGQEDAVVASRLGRDESGYALWEDAGAVVSMAGYGNPSPHGIVIGPVYTPPEFRGRGYASSLTAALSQCLLDRGRSYVALFTNLRNPISNHVYEKIGYVPVADVDNWKFIQGS